MREEKNRSRKEEGRREEKNKSRKEKGRREKRLTIWVG